ncbi:MAG: AAA family ATPase [Burkholderiaceae bacterium]|nr:MAG: AAA family ATPase [Burkholderiaceae bacterium]
MANKKRWLVSWIGNADLKASEGMEEVNAGPLATALLDSTAFDRVCLLSNYDHARADAYCRWLQQLTCYACDSIDLQDIELTSPIDYASIYEEVSKHLKALGLPKDDVALTFHLSPGTPAMAAIWIMLAKTRFAPAKLIQTSQEQGLQAVDFEFDLANHFLPEYLQRSDARIERLSQGPAPVGSPFSKIVHRSAEIGRQVQLAQRVAAHDVPVLILGETGTGKELFAEAIRAASSRSEAPFITVDCGAMTRELASSELFGHVKGAFTGATSQRKGHFQEADGGTLFLDEVGDLPPDTQVQLLRALQSKEITPLGESKSTKVNVRVIAATHRDLVADVASGRFREDLFHRLAVGILHLPPLRERSDDLDLLIAKFLEQINADSKGKPEWQEKVLSEDARKVMLAHDWPGNVRELYHTLLRSAIWSTDATIQAADVEASMLRTGPTQKDVLHRPLKHSFSLEALLDEVSIVYIRRALKKTGQRKSAAAKMLGFANHQTLNNWIKRLGLDTEAPED